MRDDAAWLPEFRVRYAEWWAAARPLLERHEYAAAFRAYPRPAVGDPPWAPVRKPLAASRVAVVTTAGLYRPGIDGPFAGEAPDGDYTSRSLPADVALEALASAHTHFNTQVALADMNTVFPLDRLREMVAAGTVGSVAPTHYSLMGYCTRADTIAEETAPAVAARMLDEGVDAALVVPV
jgi:D-proline reductase (dithiol) PrdB